MTPADAPELRHLPRLHYLLAAATIATALALLVPVAAGWHALAHPEAFTDHLTGDTLPPPSAGGWLFLVGGLLAVLYGIALGVALAVEGWSIARRRHHTFCVATSFLATFFFPLGTILGFHTINALCGAAALRAFGIARRAG